ncbi:hypothetical protein D3C76_1338160 [compost metagenome]
MQAGNAEGIAVVFDQRLSAFIGLDGQCATTGVGAHPFDADRAAAGADVPQQFAGDRRQARKGDGTHIALGQLAVVLEGGVGQPGQSGQARCIGFSHALDGDQVQVGDRWIAPVAGDTFDTPLGFAAQVFQHGESARAVATFAQQCSDGGGAAAIVAQYQQAYAAGQVGVECGDRPGHHRQSDHFLQGPTHSRCGQ